MRLISDILQEYLKTKNINISEAARVCNIDRANMHKIFYGKRHLSSPTVAKSLITYLQLTPREETEFMESFYYSLEGNTYRKRRDVEEFLARIDNSVMYSRLDLPQIHYDDSPEHTLPDISSVTSLQNVHYTAMWVLLKEFAKPTPMIRMISAAEEQDMLTSMLKSCAVENSSPVIQHVFSLAGRLQENQNYDNYNFQCFITVFALCVESGDYQPFYYYSMEAGMKNTVFPMFPYFLATSEYFMLFSPDYLHALLVSEKAVLKAEIQRFDSYLKKSRMFLEISKRPQGQTDAIHKFTEENCDIYVFNMQPSLVSLFTDEMKEKYLNSDLLVQAKIKTYSLSHFTDDMKTFEQNVNKYLISSDGLRRFLNTGIPAELPEGACSPLPMEERIWLVRNYIEKLAHKTIMLYHDIYENASCITFLAGDKNCLLYYNRRESGLCSLLISEFSILNVFRDYIDSIEADKYYPPKETACRMLELLKEYE